MIANKPSWFARQPAMMDGVQLATASRKRQAAPGSSVNLWVLSPGQGGGTGTMEIDVNESAPRRPNRFLADLAQAMSSIAETGRQALIDQCQADAKAYVEALTSQTADEAAAIKRPPRPTLPRSGSAPRRKSSGFAPRPSSESHGAASSSSSSLAEYNSAIELEVERVQERVAAFQNEVGRFFERLLQDADPTVFANMASQMPRSARLRSRARGAGERAREAGR